MINIVEKLSEDFFHSSGKIGMTKLSLLADLSEDQREEIVENIDIESTSVRELKAEIQQYKKEQHELMEKLDDTQKKYEKSEEYREELCDENDKMSLRISELLAEVDDLKDRPIDVTYSDADSHEVENMRKAMDKMDLEWSTKYAEEQERNIKEVQELNIKHTAELNQMKAEYEDKIRNAASGTPEDDTQQKSDTYLKMLDAVMDDIEDFLFNINNLAVQTKHIERFISKAQDFIENIENYEGE
jgi:myosin heavy subunit